MHEADRKPLSGWGRVPIVHGRELRSDDLQRDTVGVSLCRGLGRSYGDASLPASSTAPVVNTGPADRILHFDRTRGVLRAEAGLSLLALNTVLWPAGFAVPVSPGTQFVTLGGMVAANVHGKNHHVAGGFGSFVRALLLRVADDRVLEVGPDREPELFDATLGGMGLTGHILEVEFSLERIETAWIHEETRPVSSLDALIEELRACSRQWPFTMSWVDCVKRGPQMGRGIVRMGRWARPQELTARQHACAPRPRSGPSIPFPFPSFALNRFSIAAFNALLYRLGSRPQRHVVHPQTFFYPLDFLRDWNRMYGSVGPLQYQCVLPERAGQIHHARFFETLTRLGGASFLCVIKDCGSDDRGLLSFPMPGISVALDIAMGPGAQRLIDALNEVVLEAGGRIYLTKDALTRPEHFRAMEGDRLERFLAVRRTWDPQVRIRSALSQRLMGDPS
jgi:decaprenylphospho-beta-D-ribofuranose 2-oxidase